MSSKYRYHVSSIKYQHNNRYLTNSQTIKPIYLSIYPSIHPSTICHHQHHQHTNPHISTSPLNFLSSFLSSFSSPIGYLNHTIQIAYISRIPFHCIPRANITHTWVFIILSWGYLDTYLGIPIRGHSCWWLRRLRLSRPDFFPLSRGRYTQIVSRSRRHRAGFGVWGMG